MVAKPEIVRIGGIASGAAAGVQVAAIIAVLGITSLKSAFLGRGGEGGGESQIIDLTAINMQLNENTKKLNNYQLQQHHQVML